jgi:hypothetical protein
MSARWDAFLAMIAGRHHEVLADAEARARAFIATVEHGGDYQPLSHDLMAVRARLQDLEAKIVDTWHASAEQVVVAEGGDRDREFVKGLALTRALDDRREELEPRVFAELARRRYAAGLGDSVAAIAAHAIPQEAAIVEWRRMRAADAYLRDLRPPRPLDAILACERAQLAYWRAYLTVRARFEPSLARDLELEIRCRMEPWYVHQAEYEQAWVRAGRRRLAV